MVMAPPGAPWSLTDSLPTAAQVPLSARFAGWLSQVITLDPVPVLEVVLMVPLLVVCPPEPPEPPAPVAPPPQPAPRPTNGKRTAAIAAGVFRMREVRIRLFNHNARCARASDRD